MRKHVLVTVRQAAQGRGWLELIPRLQLGEAEPDLPAWGSGRQAHSLLSSCLTSLLT